MCKIEVSPYGVNIKKSVPAILKDKLFMQTLINL